MVMYEVKLKWMTFQYVEMQKIKPVVAEVCVYKPLEKVNCNAGREEYWLDPQFVRIWAAADDVDTLCPTISAPGLIAMDGST